MAVVAVPYYEPWIVARWAFDLLMSRLLDSCTVADDIEVVERAIALDGLHFDLMACDQSARLAESLAVVTDRLRFDLEEGLLDVPDRERFALALAELEMRLHDLNEMSPGPDSRSSPDE